MLYVIFKHFESKKNYSQNPLINVIDFEYGINFIILLVKITLIIKNTTEISNNAFQ